MMDNFEICNLNNQDKTTYVYVLVQLQSEWNYLKIISYAC